MNWRHRAACRDKDPELFFPVGTAGPAIRQIDAAKAVCRHCPVTSSCLTWALTSRQDDGIAGGLTAEERRALKRRQTQPRTPKPKPAPTPSGRAKIDPARVRELRLTGRTDTVIADMLGVQLDSLQQRMRRHGRAHETAG